MEKKDSNTVKWVVLGCGGVVIVFAGFIAVIFLVVMKATEQPELVIKKFLQHAENGELDAAYELFSVPLKEVQSFEEFQNIVQKHPSLFQVTDTTFTNRSIDQNGASFSGTITIKAGTKVPVSFHLVEENDTWKLISYNLSDGGD